eukprot:3280215-Pyramimonas_sp.AAC.3
MAGPNLPDRFRVLTIRGANPHGPVSPPALRQTTEVRANQAEQAAKDMEADANRNRKENEELKVQCYRATVLQGYRATGLQGTVQVLGILFEGNLDALGAPQIAWEGEPPA